MAITCSVCGVDSSTSLFKKRNRSRSCEPCRVGLRRVRVRQHDVRGQDVLGQELHGAVPGTVREGSGHDHGAEVVQNADLVGKDPMTGSHRAVQADAIRRGRPERLAPTPPDLAPPMFEILVLRPIEVPREQQFLVFIEELDRHVCGQCQRQLNCVRGMPANQGWEKQWASI